MRFSAVRGNRRGVLLAAAAGIALAAALLRARAPGVTPAADHGRDRTGVPTCIQQVRGQLALAPVLAAEEALQRSPDDRQTRLRLADACAGDPVGAALALSPLLDRSGDPELLARYAGYCMDVGWLDEAARALARLPAPPPRARLELAAAYAQRGAADRAAVLLERLGREARTPKEWLEGAITWYHCRRPERAVAWARQAVARAPADLAARGVLARCLLAAGQPEAALEALAPIDPTMASASGAPRPVLAFWRGRAEARCRDAARQAAGRERLARVAAAEPGNTPAAFEAGRALLLAGEAGRAVPLLSRAAVGGYQEVLCYEWLARAYEKLGRPSEALWARGRAQTYRGEFGAACVSLRRSLALAPGKPLAYVDLARALHADGRLAEAVTVLERAEQTFPASLDIRLLKAKLLLHMERVADVTRELRAAAALDPTRANEPLGNLGTVYYDSQQFDRAVPVLEQAVQLEDADAHAHFYLGRVCARRVEEPQQAEKAVYHLLRAAEMQPDFSRPWMAAAAVLQRMGYLPEAAACLRRAIAGECQSDAPYVRLAQLLQLQGRHAERRLLLKQYAAVRDHDLTRTGLEKQTRDDPKDAARRFALGDLLLREGRPEKALPELLAAAGLRPGWKQTHARLADACAVLDYDDLRAEAEHALGATRDGKDPD
jgi:tetratricopeptide (TPR) repeat protein